MKPGLFVANAIYGDDPVVDEVKEPDDIWDGNVDHAREASNTEKRYLSYFWGMVTHDFHSHCKEWRFKSKRRSLYLEDKITSNRETSFTNRGEQSKYIIHPDEHLKIFWDVIIIVLVVISCTTIPFAFGFNTEETLLSFIFSVVIDCFFAIDIIVNANTAYFNQEEQMYVFDRQVIIKKYLLGWFWIDLVAIFPFRVFGSGLGTIRIIK